jgi:hypothetical protein
MRELNRPPGTVWRSQLGGWVTDEVAMAHARSLWDHTHQVGILEIGCNCTKPDTPSVQPAQPRTDEQNQSHTTTPGPE